MPVSWSGSVCFEVNQANNTHQTRTVKLTDVWYLPSCAKNLVSGSRLICRGYKIKTNEYGLGVYSSNDTIVMNPRPKNGLFCFNMEGSAHSQSLNYNPKALVSEGNKCTMENLLHSPIYFMILLRRFLWT